MLSTSQRMRYLDRRSVYRKDEARDVNGDEINGYLPVAGEQSVPCQYRSTNQFDTRTSVAGVSNKDNLDTADFIHEELGHDVRPGDLVKIDRIGRSTPFWFTVKGAPQEIPTRGAARANYQKYFLAATPTPTITEGLVTVTP